MGKGSGPRTSEEPSGKTWKSSPEFHALAKVLGSNVRRFRKQLGWTLEAAADHFALDLAHLTRIERGTLNPTLWTLLRIAKGLEVPLKILLDDVPDEDRPSIGRESQAKKSPTKRASKPSSRG